jgi:glyoxylase-like metal-dependent hydrolase (beta-lactamase superfamily II)
MKHYILIYTLVFLSVFANSQHVDSLQQVTDDLYMITGDGGNVSFLVTDSGVLVVDAGILEMDGKRIENHIRSVTDKEIKYIVLTHYHYDHTFGVCGFTGNPLVIGHKNIKHNLKLYGQDYLNRYNNELEPYVDGLKRKTDSLKQVNDQEWEELNNEYQTRLVQLESLKKTYIVYPDITFQNNMTITLGKDTINLVYPGNAHTSCNILVEFVNQQTLATGDFLFHQHNPYIDFKANCNTENWINQINYFVGRNYKYVIPGHGALTGVEGLAEQASYLIDLRNEVERMVAENKTLDQIKDEIKLGKYDDYGFPSMMSVGAEAIYNEMTRGGWD